jgi:hypothetical protein
MSVVENPVEAAHRTATAHEPEELARELQELLGQKLVAFALGDRHPKTIGRYARGVRRPDDVSLGRLVDLYTVVTILQGAAKKQGHHAWIKTWMLGSNPRLRGKAPIETFHEGHAYRVMGAAKEFVTGR